MMARLGDEVQGGWAESDVDRAALEGERKAETFGRAEGLHTISRGGRGVVEWLVQSQLATRQQHCVLELERPSRLGEGAGTGEW